MDNVKNEMNIYQKIAVLQDVIKVNKANRNDFANFSYRTIQDIFSELKPLLNRLNLIINFGAGKLDEDKYSLELRIIDINKPDDKIVETGEIYIDRTKKQMDLSQKCLSAKTFLKKSLLEDLLLINEDDDPDSHDNRKTEQKQNNQGNKVTQNQLKRYFAIAKNKDFDTNYLDNLIKVAYNISSKNDWLKTDYEAFTNYLHTNSMQDTLNTLIAKIKKAGKPVPVPEKKS